MNTSNLPATKTEDALYSEGAFIQGEEKYLQPHRRRQPALPNLFSGVQFPRRHPLLSPSPHVSPHIRILCNPIVTAVYVRRRILFCDVIQTITSGVCGLWARRNNEYKVLAEFDQH